MKKTSFKIVAIAMLLVMATVGLVGCGNSNNNNNDPSTPNTSPINVITREDGSGTRSGFVELFEVQITGSDGKLIDGIKTSAVTTNSTAVMLTSVSSDKNAIGYISLGSLNDTVKAVSIGGVAATAANVKNNSYKYSRPFIIATKGSPNDATQDFINYIMSSQGQKVVTDNGYIAINESAASYSRNSSANGRVVINGSSSVTPVMEKLKEAYALVNSSVTIQINQTDSSTGMTSTIDGICDIGMSSRALKDSETAAGLNGTQIATDGIAVIVNTSNSVNNLSQEQVKEIFSGEVSRWNEVS